MHIPLLEHAHLITAEPPVTLFYVWLYGQLPRPPQEAFEIGGELHSDYAQEVAQRQQEQQKVR